MKIILKQQAFFTCFIMGLFYAMQESGQHSRDSGWQPAAV